MKILKRDREMNGEPCHFEEYAKERKKDGAYRPAWKNRILTKLRLYTESADKAAMFGATWKDFENWKYL